MDHVQGTLKTWIQHIYILKYYLGTKINLGFHHYTMNNEIILFYIYRVSNLQWRSITANLATIKNLASLASSSDTYDLFRKWIFEIFYRQKNIVSCLSKTVTNQNNKNIVPYLGRDNWSCLKSSIRIWRLQHKRSLNSHNLTVIYIRVQNMCLNNIYICFQVLF